MLRRLSSALPVLLAGVWGLQPGLAADAEIRFNRDIRPILSEKCFHCHGPDTAGRKAGLRFDVRDGLLGMTKKHGPVVTPGQLEKSELWRRLISADEEELMPPPKEHKPLTQGERELIRRWIAQGAPWQPHWAFIRPERPTLPPVKRNRWVRNPIDRFVLAKLESKGLTPAPEADRRTLARRLSLDLTGLPPEPAVVEAFVRDHSPKYYEAYVDRLLASSQWGEHRGRYWLDAARYGDTHGLHFDNYREIWPYRDWVIQAFNRNEPFDRFTVEQIAGDLLPDPSEDQLVATGFHRCALSTNEGGTIADENLANYARERVETTAWVWLGVTANCAVCHDHKFDPVTMKDFYSMSAFFRNTTQEAYDGNVKNTKPSLLVPQGADKARWKALPGEISAAEQERGSRRDQARPAYERWAATAPAAGVAGRMNPEGLVLQLPLNEANPAATAHAPDVRVNGSFSWVDDGPLGPAAPITSTNLIEAPGAGDFERTNAFSYAAWFKSPDPDKEVSILARMDESDGYRGYDLWQGGKRLAVHIVSRWDGDALKVSTKEEVLGDKKWHHALVTYDGSSKAAGVKIYVDGREQALRTERDALTGPIRTGAAFRVGRRSGNNALEGGLVQDVRVYRRALPPGEAAQLGELSFAAAALATPAERRAPQQREGLFDYYLAHHDQAYQASVAKLDGLKAEREAIRERSPVTLIQQERTDTQPTARLLFRGQYDQPRDELRASVFTWLAPFPAGSPTNRLGLARWLVSPENPLTARVTVNRFWQEVFGAGIVRSTVDFGIMGDPPANQELLDWLAADFQEGGWDVKRLFKLMVESAAYRQSQVSTPEKLEKDPENRWLSRGPRFRMDAEVIRDYALCASGLLNPKIGGPSVRPYQPEGVWEAVAMPESNTREYKQEHGEALYRRSMYTFWKRAAPPASMDSLNAPSREGACLRRERTDTPIQALVTLDDPQFIEAARALASVCLRAAPGGSDRTLDLVSEKLLARPLRPGEAKIARASLQRFRADYQAHPDEAKKLLAVGESPAPMGVPAPELAAWTMLANALLNLDETLNK